MREEFDVLVTDSTYKHALAAIRCLGKYKLNILTCSEGFSPSKFSIFSKKSYTYSKEEFIKKLIEHIKSNKISVVLPIGYESNIQCAKHKKEIEEYSNIFIADEKTMNFVSDKQKMDSFIKKNKFPCPRTYIIKKLEDAEKIKINSEMIIKSSREMLGKKVEYIKNKEELLKRVEERLVYGPQIVQELVSGWGCGFFALCEKGEIRASFQHKRLREYPASGGVSSLSRSYYNKELENISKKILLKLKWNGPAMIEFIFDEKDKQFKYIEFNAKFWGSLDLAIESGVDFPYLTYLSALGKKFKKPDYKKDIKFQWILPEDTLRLKTTSRKLKETWIYIKDLFNPKIKKDINYLFIDPLPTIIRIASTTYKMLFKK